MFFSKKILTMRHYFVFLGVFSRKNLLVYESDRGKTFRIENVSHLIVTGTNKPLDNKNPFVKELNYLIGILKVPHKFYRRFF